MHVTNIFLWQQASVKSKLAQNTLSTNIKVSVYLAS